MRVTESVWATGPSGKAVNGSHISSQVWLFASGGFWLAMPLSQLLVWTQAHVSDRAAVCVLLDTTTQWQGLPLGLSCQNIQHCVAHPLPHTLFPSNDKQRGWKQEESWAACWTKSTLICQQRSQHRGENTLGGFNVACNSIDPDNTWVKD